MFSFLSPWFLAGALAAAVPIVLHLMRRQPEARVKFAPVALLKRAPVEHSERRRLRELLLLVLRVGALVLLAIAFARPFIASGDLPLNGVTVVALDTSMSLAAPGRFELAQRLAHAAVEKRPSGQLVGVVTFDDTARVVHEPSLDRSAAYAAIASATPGPGGTRYADAVARAADLIGGRAGAIVVVTDLQANGWDGGNRVQVASAVQLSVEDVGEAPPNLAVTSVRAVGDSVVATIRNFGGEPRETRVRLILDEQRSDAGGAQRSVGDTLVNVVAGGAAEVVLTGAGGRAASVVVDDPEGVQADNVRYLVLEGGGPPRVDVVTASGDVGREAFYVNQALRASGEAGSAYRVAGLASGRSETWGREQLDAAAAVFLLSTRGLSRHGREIVGDYVRKGGGLLIAAGPDVEGDVTADALGGALSLTLPSESGQSRVDGAPRSVVPADTRHPMFRAFVKGSSSLGLVRFDRLVQAHGPTCRALARLASGEPVLVECASGGGRLLVFTSDLDHRWNDFPVHATFVPFLHEAVRYLAGARAINQEYLTREVPRGVPPRPGIAMLPEGAAGEGRRIAVNVDPDESEPARLSRDVFFAGVARPDEAVSEGAPRSAREQEERQHLWRYVVWLMLAVLILESALGARTA